MRKIIIIGGGASGIMAAISAARHGAEVTILEHKDRIGKKILSTGNGRCNFTNLSQQPQNYCCDESEFPWQVISRFPAEDTIAFFQELGIYAKDRGGYLYPFSDQASSVLDVLRMELERLTVRIETSVNVKQVIAGKKGFQIQTDHGKYFADRVILATGSKAAPVTGSDGSGYDLAKSLGHHLIPVVPALVQLRCKESFYKSVSGIRIQGKVSLYVNGKISASDTGEIQLTNYGISGIPVFQVSRYAAKGLYHKQKVEAVLDFMPEYSLEEFFLFLKKRMDSRPEKTLEDFFVGLFHKKIAALFVKRSGLDLKKQAGKLQIKELERLVHIIKEFRTFVVDTNGFENGQICAGGVSTKEVNPETLESALKKGLYLVGELLDVDGICGGYNLQWAWSSGYIAGREAAK